MITPTSLANMTPPEKAQVIYEQARSDMAGRLWRAALGVEDAPVGAAGSPKEGASSLNLLIALLDEQRGAAPTPPPLSPAPPKPTASAPMAAPMAGPALEDDQGQSDGRHSAQHGDQAGTSAQRSASANAYGPNAGYAAILGAASKRTGLPAAALATIVHAEAAKDKDGRWMPYSRNPRSSAAGLGQFLSGTWTDEANRKGTWLNAMAAQNGWLNNHGRVKGEHRSALLSLRYNPQAAIEATADYAAANLDALRKAGVVIQDSAQDIARAAYLGHHLGRGDAIRFLKGGLDPERARVLLNAQVGVSASSRRIAAAGNAISAHRSWLNNYIKTNIQVDRFSA